jgi:hypothetical protein
MSLCRNTQNVPACHSESSNCATNRLLYNLCIVQKLKLILLHTKQNLIVIHWIDLMVNSDSHSILLYLLKQQSKQTNTSPARYCIMQNHTNRLEREEMTIPIVHLHSNKYQVNNPYALTKSNKLLCPKQIWQAPINVPDSMHFDEFCHEWQLNQRRKLSFLLNSQYEIHVTEQVCHNCGTIGSLAHRREMILSVSFFQFWNVSFVSNTISCGAVYSSITEESRDAAKRRRPEAVAGGLSSCIAVLRACFRSRRCNGLWAWVIVAKKHGQRGATRASAAVKGKTTGAAGPHGPALALVTPHWPAQ